MKQIGGGSFIPQRKQYISYSNYSIQGLLPTSINSAHGGQGQSPCNNSGSSRETCAYMYNCKHQLHLPACPSTRCVPNTSSPKPKLPPQRKAQPSLTCNWKRGSSEGQQCELFMCAVPDLQKGRVPSQQFEDGHQSPVQLGGNSRDTGRKRH